MSAEAEDAETMPFTLVAATDGLFGMGGGADLPLAMAAGPEAIFLSMVGEVEIVLRKGVPAMVGPSAAPVVVGDGGVEWARSI